MSRRSFLSIFIVTTCIFSSIYAQETGFAENPLIRKASTADHPNIIEIPHLNLNDVNDIPLLPARILPLTLPDGDVFIDI